MLHIHPCSKCSKAASVAANDELIWELGQVCKAVGNGKNPFRIFKKILTFCLTLLQMYLYIQWDKNNAEIFSFHINDSRTTKEITFHTTKMQLCPNRKKYFNFISIFFDVFLIAAIYIAKENEYIDF